MGTRVQDKVVVVTGAAQGIGRAFAHRLAGEGARVVVADLNGEKAAAVAAEIGPSALAVVVDVSKDESVDALGSVVGDTYGRVDGIINNAAIFSTIQMKPFWELTTAEWDVVQTVNLRGPFLIVKALLPLLKASSAASIVNIGSDAVWEGRGGYLHYTASKAGVQGMTFGMSHELGEFDIRVNTISPAATQTEVPRATVSPAQLEAMIAARALHRVATPEDLTSLAVFLLSEESVFITGQTISVNGGKLHR
ncbi:SDR family NAD(P)-dependent oxidoreductase [Microbacterium pygmaeum]|uniref:3-oxoacyl-[acyl-carrier protein] reductase n=1 Tax=Microbacterium pygmaeum TaxID=370764 RepID=A0A1G7W826_9MICO|nr:SDR family oxidoreductase [Microbacterium pygmaeum]SDG68142.1 3-oxoacyl-[acyl-carrier protein] reductase [Microbacterium pygmaeum]